MRRGCDQLAPPQPLILSLILFLIRFLSLLVTASSLACVRQCGILYVIVPVVYLFWLSLFPSPALAFRSCLFSPHTRSFLVRFPFLVQNDSESSTLLISPPALLSENGHDLGHTQSTQHAEHTVQRTQSTQYPEHTALLYPLCRLYPCGCSDLRTRVSF